jgi:Flp pilus assembly protein CpaB
MNRKQLTLLIVVAAVLGGLGWLAWQKQQTPFKESMAQVGEQLFPNFPINDVEHVTIRVSTNELNLLKKEDIWTVAERGNYPANWNNISDFLRKVYELKVAKPVKAGPSRLGPLQLPAPVGRHAGRVQGQKRQDHQNLDAGRATQTGSRW